MFKIARFVVLATALVLPGTIINAQDRPSYGMVTSIQFLQDDPGSNIYGRQRMNELGIGSVRIGIDWSVVQPSPGGPFDFSFVDAMIANAMADGIEVFANLGEPPSWAAACSVCVPYDMNAWYTYVHAVIGHYAPYGSRITYGVWNEPNDTKFFKTNPGQPDGQLGDVNAYATVAYYALAARNAAVPSVRFALPDSTPAAWTSNWFQQFAGLIGPYIAGHDIVAVHYYPQSMSLETYLNNIINYTGRETWLTEWGPLTPTSDNGQVGNIASVFGNFRNRTGALLNWKRHFYYRLWDGDCCLEAILRPDWSPRPGFSAFRNLMPTLVAGTVLPPGGSWISQDSRFTLTYQTDGNLVLYMNGTTPIWWSGTNGTAAGQTVMQGDGNLVVYDGFGNPVWYTATSGNPGANNRRRSPTRVAY